jgi:ABC-type sugar transport system substrate-binding protein
MKMRVIRKISIAVLVFISIVVLIGCNLEAANKDAKEDRAVRVAFSQTESSNPWITDMINSFEMAAAYQSMEFIYHIPQDNTTEWQREDLMGLLEEDIDYLIIAPRETTILPDVLTKAKEKGIPVILMSSQADMESEDLYATSISTDYVQEGIMCAKILAEKYKGKECRIIEIKGTEGSSIARDRSAGFRGGDQQV